MWYVVMDDEGPWITQEPSDGDEILFQSESQTEAETVLCRECNGWESEDDDMNDFDGDEEDDEEDDE